jgi:TFIIF-interacting CTD phosphatase-like protein
LNRDLSQTIAVDDCPGVYQLYPNNVIACKAFYGSSTEDDELDKIAEFLVAIKDVEDVRKYCR